MKRHDSDDSPVAAKLQRFGSFWRKALYKYGYLFYSFIYMQQLANSRKIFLSNQPYINSLNSPSVFRSLYHKYYAVTLCKIDPRPCEIETMQHTYHHDLVIPAYCDARISEARCYCHLMLKLEKENNLNTIFFSNKCPSLIYAPPTISPTKSSTYH